DDVGELACGRSLRRGVVVVPGVQDELRRGTADARERADEQLAQVSGARVRVDERDAGTLCCCERAGGGVGRVVEVANRMHHTFASRLPDVDITVDNT